MDDDKLRGWMAPGSMEQAGIIVWEDGWPEGGERNVEVETGGVTQA